MICDLPNAYWLYFLTVVIKAVSCDFYYLPLEVKTVCLRYKILNNILVLNSFCWTKSYILLFSVQLRNNNKCLLQAYYLTGGGSYFDLSAPNNVKVHSGFLNAMPASQFLNHFIGSISSNVLKYLAARLPADNLPRNIAFMKSMNISKCQPYSAIIGRRWTEHYFKLLFYNLKWGFILSVILSCILDKISVKVSNKYIKKLNAIYITAACVIASWSEFRFLSCSKPSQQI